MHVFSQSFLKVYRAIVITSVEVARYYWYCGCCDYKIVLFQNIVQHYYAFIKNEEEVKNSIGEKI